MGLKAFFTNNVPLYRTWKTLANFLSIIFLLQRNKISHIFPTCWCFLMSPHCIGQQNLEKTRICSMIFILRHENLLIQSHYIGLHIPYISENMGTTFPSNSSLFTNTWKLSCFSQKTKLAPYLHSNSILATYSSKLKNIFYLFSPKVWNGEIKIPIFKPPLHQLRCRNSYFSKDFTKDFLFYPFMGIKNYELNRDTIPEYVLVLSIFVLPL